jgi:hypothetical protein
VTYILTQAQLNFLIFKGSPCQAGGPRQFIGFRILCRPAARFGEGLRTMSRLQTIFWLTMLMGIACLLWEFVAVAPNRCWPIL